MYDNKKTNSYDDISKMIENNTGDAPPPSPEMMGQALRSMASSADKEKATSLWIKRYNDLPPYKLDVVRNNSNKYVDALKEAILAITRGEYGSIDYKGYRIYYSDTPHVKSISLKDGHMEYSYHVSFQCDALMCGYYEEYHSEEDRKAFIDPESNLFEKTVALLDKEIELLDEGTWIKKRKKLNIYDFKDYSSKGVLFKQLEWEDRNNNASTTFSYLLEDAVRRARGDVYTEDVFKIYSDIIRRMVFFADYGKRNYLCDLEYLIRFKWKPETKQDRYIWRCMDEFGQGDLPDRLLDNCTLYYLLEDPHGWESLAYILPLVALWEMCHDYEPDSVKNELLKVFDLIPNDGYKDRIEKLIEEDRARTDKKGDYSGDQESV